VKPPEAERHLIATTRGVRQFVLKSVFAEQKNSLDVWGHGSPAPWIHQCNQFFSFRSFPFPPFLPFSLSANKWLPIPARRAGERCVLLIGVRKNMLVYFDPRYRFAFCAHHVCLPKLWIRQWRIEPE